MTALVCVCVSGCDSGSPLPQGNLSDLQLHSFMKIKPRRQAWQTLVDVRLLVAELHVSHSSEKLRPSLMTTLDKNSCLSKHLLCWTQALALLVDFVKCLEIKSSFKMLKNPIFSNSTLAQKGKSSLDKIIVFNKICIVTETIYMVICSFGLISEKSSFTITNLSLWS